MKNNQKKRCNQQPRQNQQPQRRNVAAMLADINITVDTVNISRDEYDELLYCSALVDILHRLYKTSDKYTLGDLLENIFRDGEKGDK